MRIAMIGWEYPPFITGGLGVHCYELTRALALLGVEVDFYMPRAKGAGVFKITESGILEINETEKEGIRIVGIRGIKNFYGGYEPDLRSETILKKLFERQKINIDSGGAIGELYGGDFFGKVDLYNKKVAELVAKMNEFRKYNLIHAHDWLTIRGALEARTLTGLPVVLTIHATEYDRAPVPWDKIHNVEIRGVKEADRVIAVSNRTKAQLVDKMGGNPNKIKVVYNGVDSSKFNIRKRKERNTVLFLGRLTDQKGPFQFLGAAKEVLNQYKDVRFLIVGKGPLMPLLIEEAFRMGIQNNVIFMGFVPENFLRKAYSQSDVYVMPSVSEPFGITALEALSSGTPLVISKSTGVGESIRHCFKVDFWDTKLMAEKIIALLKFEVLHKEIAKNGMKEAQKFNWIKVAEKTIQVYREVVRNPGPVLELKSERVKTK